MTVSPIIYDQNGQSVYLGNIQADLFVLFMFSEEEHKPLGPPATDEPALLGHSLQLLQDGTVQEADPRTQICPRRRSLSVPSVPYGGNTTYPLGMKESKKLRRDYELQ